VELIDVVIQYSDRTPEGGILAISINRLLIRFVRLIKITRRHISPSKQIPREWIISIYYLGFQGSVMNRKK
jgi:hypothetical protein